jgi:hypothetical protein
MVNAPNDMPFENKLIPLNSDSLAASLPGNITTTQFLNWNRNIIGLCDSVTAGQYICVA